MHGIWNRFELRIMKNSLNKIAVRLIFVGRTFPIRWQYFPEDLIGNIEV